MSSKIALYLFILLLIAGCGVKAKPAFPPDTAIPNYIDHYTEPNLNSEVKK